MSQMRNFEIEMQSNMYTRYTDRQTNTHMLWILCIKCAAKQKIALTIMQKAFNTKEYRWIKNQYTSCSLSTLGNVLKMLTLLL